MDKNLLKSLAIGAVAVVAAFGAWALGKSSSSGSTTATVQQARAPQFDGGGPPQAQAGQAPPGFGAEVTGATAEKVEKLVLAKYPGQIEVVVQLPDGSYVAHDITSSGELHVGVSKDFKITGTDAGGPPRGAAPPASALSPTGRTSSVGYPSSG